MGQDTKIEWAHHTFNPDSGWREPIKWNRLAKEAGEVHRVFCASLADVGEGEDTMPEESWPVVQAARARLVDLFDGLTNLKLLLLTKRPQNMARLFPKEFLEKHYVGTSCEDQKTADERIPHLLRCPAAVRFLSCEPLLGPIDLDSAYTKAMNAEYIYLPHGFEGKLNECANCECGEDAGDHGFRCTVCGGACQIQGIGWVIAGGESGPHERPMHPDWARGLRDQCQAAGAAFFFKQWGEWLPRAAPAKDGHQIILNSDGTKIEIPSWDRMLRTRGPEWIMDKVGKHRAGRLLDDQTWDEFPKVAEASHV